MLPLQEPGPGAGHKWVQRRGFSRAPVAVGWRGSTGLQDEWGVGATSWLLLELQGWAQVPAVSSSPVVWGSGGLPELRMETG